MPRRRDMKRSPALRIEREPSIESEPRTLSSQQLHFAREAALYILKTKSLEEAISIFTEGLQPVLSLDHGERKLAEVDDEAGESDHVAVKIHSRLPHPLLAVVKDILSAPF